jgi:hypothetical protein
VVVFEAGRAATALADAPIPGVNDLLGGLRNVSALGKAKNAEKQEGQE